MVGEWRREKREPTEAGKDQQQAQDSRQEGRLEDEIANQEAIEGEKYESDVCGFRIYFQKNQSQVLELIQIERAKRPIASQDDQRRELKNSAEGQNGATHQAKERRKQRDGSVYRLE